MHYTNHKVTAALCIQLSAADLESVSCLRGIFSDDAVGGQRALSAFQYPGDIQHRPTTSHLKVKDMSILKSTPHTLVCFDLRLGHALSKRENKPST